MICALRCSHTNIESYGRRLLVRTLRLKPHTLLHTSSEYGVHGQQSLYAQWPVKSKDLRILTC